ncbi:exodeoxyribonuclease V subunit gamma [Chlamydia crocodili]|uniref:Exodeoxyribonuclease V subunit gamma n=1 Tax=Chlamydia crocodili TaxID=2766982 RepID=A0ABX8CEV3_9CHLA|nr:exodeoxyribonuclease V subunit gamma [Chlamydia crocodili]QVE49538.1 exodeoxyribonuclease V subunit gamma [Chlamydia crocodili]
MNATKHSQAIFSNSPIHLLAKLAEDLFSTYQQPFTKRWILVANTEIGHWLRRELTNATSNHIFMGSTIFSSSDSLVKHLFAEVCHEKPLIPDYITLPLFIHELLNITHPSIDVRQSKLLSEPSYSSTKSLAAIFKKFYTFSQAPSEKNRYHKDLFSQLDKHFIPINKVFSSVLDALGSEKQNRSLHIFGYSHLPKHFATFFTELSSFFPVYFYCFSPSREYFGDLLSDKSIDFLWRQFTDQSNRDAWEHYILADRQALLANLSHKSQASQNFFLDKEVHYSEAFVIPQETTSLSVLQSNLFHLRPNSPGDTLGKEQTVTIRKALNPSREVHEVFLKISSLLHKGVLPEEIFILSSQLETYKVYLKAVFQPHLPLYFTNNTSPYAEDLKEKFLLLSSILQTQGNLYRLLQLLIHPQLQNPIDINKTPYLLKKLSSEWEKLFKGDGVHIQNLGNNILNEYPFVEEHGKVSQIEIWERILPLLYDLQKLMDIYSSNAVQTYDEHFTQIISSLESIFVLSSEELSLIASLKNSIFPTFSSSKCSLMFFTDFCLDFFDRFCGNSPIYDKPGPYVGSLGDLSFIPKGYTFILGANKNTQAIDLLDLTDSTTQEELVFSSSENEENFHFLQTLVTTKYELHVSYQSSTHNPVLPSAYVNYLQEALNLSITHLPSKAYAPSLFSKKNLVHASQEYHYKLAKAFCSIKEPLPSLFEIPKNTTNLPLHLSVSQIIKSVSSPLDFFLKSNYHVSLRAPATLEIREKLFPTKKQVMLFWENHLSNIPEYIPNNYQSAFSKDLFASYNELIEKWLEKVRLNPLTDPHSVIFSSSLFHDHLRDQDRVLPPVCVNLNGREIFLHGTFFGVFSNGIYSCSIDPKAKIRKVIKKTKAIPDSSFEIQNYLKAYIAIAMLQQSNAITKHAIIRNIISKDHFEDLSLPFSNPEKYLNRVLQVYQMMKEHPIPLISSECWKCLDNPEKFHESIHTAIETDANDPALSLFWKFHNRDYQDQFIVTEKQRLLILSLFKDADETV